MPHLNFAIEVIEQAGGKYLIAVQSSPVGETSVVVDSPFTKDDIDRTMALFGGDTKVSRFEAQQAARQFGGRLFNFLIRQNDDINAAYFTSLDRAGNEGLRIRLSVEKAGALADLPWELLADPNRDFLALSRATPVVRYTQQLSIRPPVPFTTPLRVLVMISAPADFPGLDVEGEWQRLNTATADLQKKGVIQLERLDSATLIALQRKLRAQDYQIFHYIGHSAFDQTTQQGMLVLEREDDEKKGQLISGADFARELGEESTIRLVVLNSCESARRTELGPFAGIASAIVVRGIPAVVAMQFPISDAAATVFAEEFYRAIAELLPIDSAVSEARRAIANRIGNTEWATPVLYMRAPDGVLFRSPKRETLATKRVTSLQIPLPTFIALVVLFGVMGIIGITGIVAALRGSSPPPKITPPPAVTEPVGLPNLQVANIRTSPSQPAPGQPFRLLISIRNAGEVESGAFNWTWDASPLMLNALEGRVENIAPGASQNISFPYNYGWWGSYSSQIFVDADGEVDESDERDNREPAVIELNPTSPFEIDFTLVPPNEIVEPPLVLAEDAFFNWNLGFSQGDPADPADPNCAESTFQLIDIDFDTVLTPNGDVGATCTGLPLVIILRRPVSAASAELIAEGNGEATLATFSDTQGTAVVFESEPAVLSTGDTTLLDMAVGAGQRVRRIEVRAPGQRINLSTLTLFPVGE